MKYLDSPHRDRSLGLGKVCVLLAAVMADIVSLLTLLSTPDVANCFDVVAVFIGVLAAAAAAVVLRLCCYRCVCQCLCQFLADKLSRLFLFSLSLSLSTSLPSFQFLIS